MNTKKTRGIGGAGVLIVVLLIFAALWLTNQFDAREKMMSWQQFEELIEGDNVASVTVNQNKSVPTGRVEVTLKTADENGDELKY